jgi:4-amino-4-deoxy-L-arabinose transferase-like glycosyltransferase
VAGLVFLGWAVQALVLAAGKIPWTSDQGIVALMGRHISRLEHWPLFCYGSFYGGTLEPHFTAIVFSILGPTVLAYRISLMLLLGILIAVTATLTRAAFGSRAGAIAAAYLAVPPYFFLLKGLTSDGAYDTLAVLGGVILYSVLRLEASVRAGEPSRFWPFLIGLCAGLGWWVHPVFLYFYPSILLWLFLVSPPALRRLGKAPWAFAGLLIGSAPWLLVNLFYGWPSLRVPEAAGVPLRQAAYQFFQFWRDGVGVLFGGRPFYGWHDVFPGARLVALGLFAIAFVGAASLVTLNRTRLRSADADPAARPALLAILTILCMQILVSFNARSYQSDPRFLFPMYVPFAMLLGWAVVRLGESRRRLAFALAAAVVCLNAFSLAAGPSHSEPMQPTTGSLKRLIEVLDERGLRDVYTGYWTAYRIAFESKERIYAAAFGRERTDRYPAYFERVGKSPRPAVVLGLEEAKEFEEYLASRGAHARQIRVDAHKVFWDLPPEIVDEMRRLRRIPDGS